MNFLSWLWLGGAVLFGIVESATSVLVSVWFIPGCFVAMLCALSGLSITFQVVAFSLTSALALAATRPLVKKLQAKGKTPTNSDRLLQMQGKVTEEINNESAQGSVYIDGKTWTARSADGTIVPLGTQVRVVSIEGVKLFVSICNAEQVLSK